MTNFASTLRAEVTRLARKELRTENETLKKSVATHRSEIAALKRRLADLEKVVKQLGKAGGKAKAAVKTEAESEEVGGKHGHRFRASGLATNRKRLGLSAADFGLLVGTTGQSIYAWETGKSKPRPKTLLAISALRGIGKKEVAEKLAALKG